LSKLSKIVGISQTAIENNISKLKESGVLKRIGPAKGGHWEVKN
jgi:ATP-dependent DNA helicase RecG